MMTNEQVFERINAAKDAGRLVEVFSDEQELADFISDAMDDAMDQDVGITQLAKAAARALWPELMSIYRVLLA